MNILNAETCRMTLKNRNAGSAGRRPDQLRTVRPAPVTSRSVQAHGGEAASTLVPLRLSRR
jgi:hypothetical protein